MISTTLFRGQKKISFSAKKVQRIVQYVCKQEKILDAKLSFVFIDDRKMRAINKKFLMHNGTTDIITFPLEEKKIDAEIYINVAQAKKQAKKFLTTMKNEMIRLIVHGTLHSFGYIDTNPADKKVMFDRQERYVAKLSLLLRK